MKKLKLLPLLGASLLALTACGSEAVVISREKANELYDKTTAYSYTGERVSSLSSFDFKSGADHNIVGPKAVKLKGNGTEVNYANEDFLNSDYITKYLAQFKDTFVVDPVECYFNNNDAAFLFDFADVLGEKPEYRLEGKVLTVSFTGSTHELFPDTLKKYGVAVTYEAVYNEVGLLSKASYRWAMSTDDDGNGAQTSLVYYGDLQFKWTA